MPLRTSAKRTSYATWLFTVLSIVTNYGASASPKTIAEAVLQKQLRVILQDCQNKPTWKPLHAAAYRGYVQAGSELLKQADPNLLTDKGTPPLVFAAQGGHYTFVSLLLKAGAKINLAGKEFTALMRAAVNGHVDIIRLLCPPKCINNLSTAELLAVANGNYAKTEQRNNWRETALYCAALCGQKEAVAALLDAGAEHHVVATCNFNWSHRPLAHYIYRTMIDCDTDDDSDEELEDTTPLYVTCLEGDTEIVKLLLSRYLSNLENSNRGKYLSNTLEKLADKQKSPGCIIEFLKAGISATWKTIPAFVFTTEYKAAYQAYDNLLGPFIMDQDIRRLLLAFTGWPAPGVSADKNK